MRGQAQTGAAVRILMGNKQDCDPAATPDQNIIQNSIIRPGDLTCCELRLAECFVSRNISRPGHYSE